MMRMATCMNLSWLLGWLLLGEFHRTAACSCFGPIDLETTLMRVDSVIEALVLYEIFPFGRPSPENFVGFRYWEALIMDPTTDVRVGCEFDEQLVLIRTGSSSASCGVTLTPFTPMLLSGYQGFDRIQGYHYWSSEQTPVITIGLCDHNVPLVNLTDSDRAALESLDPPDCTCDETECGMESMPGMLCPDGITNSTVVCAKKQGECAWIQPDCPSCQSDADCNEMEYCQDFICRADGTCETAVDCFNPSNRNFGPTELPPDCVLDWSCSNGMCEHRCCEGVVNCFAQPCAVTECDIHNTRCVDNYCEACGAIFFDRGGRNVCTGGDPTICTPSDCQPPPDEVCPDGSFSNATGNCVYEPLQGACVAEVTGCPSCTMESDCPEEQFCSNGYCRLATTCAEDHDCYNSNNDLGPIIQCVAERKCEGEGVCGISCCVNQTSTCFEDPCSAPCDQEWTECYQESCSSCNPIFIDASGNRVCQKDPEECTPNDCGPPPPGAPLECPDGSIGGISGNCIYNPDTQSCEFEIIECPMCTMDADCLEMEFCSEGFCRTQGTCGSRGDCYNPSNDLGATIACIFETECLGGTCSITCCTESCDFSPCDATECPDLMCVDDTCGDRCEAIYFADDGSITECPTNSEEGCTASECGPPPTTVLGLCPDSTQRTYVCDEIEEGTCMWRPSNCPVPCIDSTDCDEDEYCMIDGVCGEDGSCTVVADCSATGNDYEFEGGPLSCFYLVDCTDGSCTATCI